jgi:hypothetical protein
MGRWCYAVLTCGLSFEWETWKLFIPELFYFDGRCFRRKTQHSRNCHRYLEQMHKPRFNHQLQHWFYSFWFFDFLPWNTFLACRCVCKQWYQLLQSSASWPQSQIDYAKNLWIHMILILILKKNGIWWVELNYGDHLCLQRTSPYKEVSVEEWVLSKK